MKIACSKAALVNGIHAVYRAVSPKPAMPVLSGILMETCSKGLRLVAYDLDLGIETFIPVTIEQDGVAVMPAKYLADITRRLPHSEVSITYREDVRAAEITSDRASFTVKTMPAHDFPSLPEIAASHTWVLPETGLKTMIRRTMPAAAADDSRAVLTGICTTLERDNLTMTTTDSFRLAHRTMAIEGGLDSTVSAVIPVKAMSEVEKNLAADGDRMASLAITDRYAMVQVGSTTYITRLLEGQFPNVRQVFPQNIPARITCDRLQLLDSIERVSIMCKDELSAIRMSYSGDEGMASGYLTISATTPDAGEAVEDIPVSLEGHASLQVAMRARYLRDVLRVLDGEEVTLGYTSFKHPIEVKDPSDPDYTYLLMPVTSPA